MPGTRRNTGGNDPVLPGDVDDAGRPLIGLSYDYPAGTAIPAHRHLRHQLLYAGRGVMSVGVAEGEWVVPPLRAVWVPAEVEHAVRARGRLAMRTLYLHPEVDGEVSARCEVIEVTPLLRELTLRAVEHGELRRGCARDERLLAMILDEIAERPVAPLHLPEPADPRLRKVTAALRREPADDRSLAAWGEFAGASGRTLARLFERETGLTFAQWRRQARLLAALEGLAEGRAVKVVAMETGYASASAFVAMFRRALGATPARYFTP